MPLRVARITVQSRALHVVEAQEMFNVVIIIIIIFSDPNAVKIELIIREALFPTCKRKFHIYYSVVKVDVDIYSSVNKEDTR